MIRHSIAKVAIAALISLSAAPASAFEIGFDWSGLKLCTSGNPNNVANPRFVLKNVPNGTQFLRFKLIDKDVPHYNHGGGTVAYSGQPTVEPGAFRYKSPCPPNGAHTYQWQVTAQSQKSGGSLGTAAASRRYPE